MSLSERRAAIIAEHVAQEKYDPHWKGEAEKGRRISERPVAFVVNDEVVVLADDVPKVMAAVEAFFAKISADRDALLAKLASEPAFAQSVEKCKLLLERPPAGELRVSQNCWNCVAYALQDVEFLVVLADGRVAVPVSLLEWLKQPK